VPGTEVPIQFPVIYKGSSWRSQQAGLFDEYGHRPHSQFVFYPSANALALQVVNEAVNSSNLTWATPVTGGPRVRILGYDSNPVPALFAQGYHGAHGTHYLVISNKSGAARWGRSKWDVGSRINDRLLRFKPH
jgi:hypothetical protein